MVKSPYLVKPGKRVDLKGFPTRGNGQFKQKEDSLPVTQALTDRIGELQEILYAQAKHAMLVVLQAMDTGGKDGAIRTVFAGVNPQGCSVTSFKAPSSEEFAHDYLWRIHHHTPAKGMMAVFNRSHYESLLIERVREIVPEKVWRKRFEHVNAFEKMLADEGTTIVKFFLHISKEEQKERLEARLKDPHKNWKFNAGDLAERKLWDQYQKAYEDALSECSTNHAPWYIIPGDRKWLRNWVMADILVRTMEELDLEFPKPMDGLEGIVVE